MLEAIILGIIQGLTEFIPISSSAHLRLAGEVFPNAVDPGAMFTAITQIGTELAVLIFFRKDIARIFIAWFSSLRSKNARNQDSKMGWLIIVGSVPIVVIGYLAQDLITKELRSLWVIATMMVVFGLVLGAADRFGARTKELSQLNVKHGILYGLAQSLALVPGVSRSGATIAMGRFLGYSREASLRYSFLLALPAVFGSGLYELKSAISENQVAVYSLPETLVATIIAFVIGYLVIAWLLKFVTTKSFAPFIIYRVLLGTSVLVLLASGVLQP
ncbi:MAG: undecaprenyl-diphosphate phosphatase [Actinobacteria bacterium]|uniref:Undecaprenyl-diphosphatase n=1 Tax=freshwater metagenome TaxID=449393 RepID=A0A6J6ICY4_9ZZZZ|nr:undecaprenyl-diphosphate phosphatase [Actinomycetota bacterium]